MVLWGGGGDGGMGGGVGAFICRGPCARDDILRGGKGRLGGTRCNSMLQGVCWRGGAGPRAAVYLLSVAIDGLLPSKRLRNRFCMGGDTWESHDVQAIPGRRSPMMHKQFRFMGVP